MARYKPQEIVRRDAIPARRAEVPILAVHADQEPARTSGTLAKVAGRGIAMLGSIYAEQRAQKKADQAEADFNEGVAYRQQEDILGLSPAPAYVLGDLSADLLRGHQAADFPMQLARWQREAVQKLATLEPDEDPEPHLQELTTELLDHAAMQDPRLRNNAMTLMQEAVTKVRTEHQKGAASELLIRQQETLNANVQAALRDGTPLGEIVEQTRALTNTAEYGYLHNREADALSASAIADALASGEVDIAATLDALDSITDAQGVKWMDGVHGEALRLAASKGIKVQEAQRAEARENAQVELERPLRELARQGRLTDDKVLEVADQLGMEGQERLTFVRHWFNAQEQGIKAIEAEAGKRRKEAEAAHQQRENSLWLSEQANRTILDRRLQDAAALPDAQRKEAMQAVLDDAVQYNIVPTYYQNLLRLGGYDDADRFAQQAQLYQQLRAQSPAFASKAAGTRAAVYDQYHEEVTEAGHSEQAFLTRMGTTKRDGALAAHLVSTALNDAKKAFPTVELDGHRYERPEEDWFHIQRSATRLATDNPGITGEAALKAAVEAFDNRHVTINGRRVPNTDLQPGHAAGVTHFVQALAQRIGTPERALTAYPLPGNSAQWVVTDEPGFPITDPDTGTRLVFNPETIGGYWQDWNNALTAVQVRNRSLEAQMKRLQTRLHVPAAGAGSFQNQRTDELNRRKRERDEAAIEALMASPDYQQMLRDREFRTTEISGVPVDFLRYVAHRNVKPSLPDE